VEVKGQPQQDFRHLSSILAVLEQAQLPIEVKAQSQQVFAELARAEARVHNIDVEEVHFHEVGAIDTIVDIVGTVIGLHHLGIRRLIASPLPAPHGFIRCDHGILPLPAPAVCEILQGVPCYGVDVEDELVTPTGAALIKVLAADYGILPPMTIMTTGYGAGSRTLSLNRPNLFRLIVGEAAVVDEVQQVEVLETHIDDWSPEGFPHLCDLLLAGGALDVSLTPIQMKKGRPGYKLQVICSAAHTSILKDVIFRETSAIGLRFHTVQRQTLPREMIEVTTPWGTVTAKKVMAPDGATVYPEYEACRKLAIKTGIALPRIYRAVIQGREEE
jgi:hypothetical protein